jgi:hypothetical protein
MRGYTSFAFSKIQRAFTQAAKAFDPSTGIPSPAREIYSDGYDTDQIRARNRRESLSNGLRRWSTFLQQVMIRRTHHDRIWGSPLLALPQGELKLVCVRFCDAEGEVYQNYQQVINAAVRDACHQRQDQLAGNTGARQDLPINTYRRCRIASSIPALCCIPTLKEANWDKATVDRYRTPPERLGSPYKPFTDTIIRLSPKLLWLRDFISTHLGSAQEGNDEKLLIFSFSPMVLHCVDLV